MSEDEATDLAIDEDVDRRRALEAEKVGRTWCGVLRSRRRPSAAEQRALFGDPDEAHDARRNGDVD